jgi:hypothetical protein
MMVGLQLTDDCSRWVSTIVALPILFYTSWELYERSKSDSFFVASLMLIAVVYSVWIEGPEESC